jgi:hypothetical protein
MKSKQSRYSGEERDKVEGGEKDDEKVRKRRSK